MFILGIFEKKSLSFSRYTLHQHALIDSKVTLIQLV